MEKIFSSWPDQQKTRGHGDRDVRSLVGGQSAALLADDHVAQSLAQRSVGISWSQYGGKTGIWRLCASRRT